MSTKATAARIYEYGEPDVFRFETMDVPDPVGCTSRHRAITGENHESSIARRDRIPSHHKCLRAKKGRQPASNGGPNH